MKTKTALRKNVHERITQAMVVVAGRLTDNTNITYLVDRVIRKLQGWKFTKPTSKDIEAAVDYSIVEVFIRSSQIILRTQKQKYRKLYFQQKRN